MHISIETVEGKRIKVEIEDSSKTIDHKIHGPTRQLVIRLSSDPDPDPDQVMKIYVTTLSGRTLTLGVKKSSTIKEVKAKCAEKEGLPTNQVRLIFQRKQLEDSHTLADYNIKHDSTLVMMLHLCGC